MLHIINRSPLIKQCLRFVTPQDAILLIAEGVYAALANPTNSVLIKHAPTIIYVLQEDLIVRGISKKLIADIPVISYTDFVDLTLKHNPIQTWS